MTMNDIKLIATDMDGTLLDSQKRMPQDLFSVLDALRARGTSFAVASGRQYAALRRDFQALAEHILFIAENGALIMQNDRRVFIDPMDAAILPEIIAFSRTLEHTHVVLCRADVALIEDTDSPAFVEEVQRYYPSMQIVDDLAAHCDADDVCKVAFYDEGDAQTHELPAMEAAFGDRLAVILSGEHWVDLMKPGVHKGCAMQALMRQMNITPDNCMAFGDYLNDAELLAAVTHSYAMENAHPALKAIARHIAPSNDEDGVMRVIKERFSL